MLAVVNVKLVSNFSVVGFGSNIVGSIECKLLFLQISVLTEKILCPKGKRKTDLIIFASFLNDTFLQCLMRFGNDLFISLQMPRPVHHQLTT